MKKTFKYRTIDEYIRLFPPKVRKKLAEMRKIIQKQAPGAQEKISYRMPAFYLNGNLVYFAAHSEHIGFYPMPSAIRAFQKKLMKYTHAKGSVQFPMDDPLPAGLITEIIRFRVAENARQE